MQASQLNMAGTGIATFSDRLRDAVRGGGPFDDDPRIQGFASGLFTDPNDSPANGTAAEQRTRLLHYQDLIRLGLAANLRDYTFLDSTGQLVRGADVDYNGQPAGYAADPGETITYVDAHDNETLFDVLTHKLPRATAMADRVRMNTVALATTALAQSPSFWHAGNDLLRSKSLDRNSYDSGDWFNRVDWSDARVDLRLRAAAGARQREQVGLHAAAARRPGAQAGCRSDPDCARARPRAAPDPLLLAAVPARQRPADPGPRQLPQRRAGPDARRDRDGHRRPCRPRHRSQARGRGRRLQRITRAGRRARRRPSPAGATGSTPSRPGVATRSCADPATTAVSGTFTVPARTVAVFVAPR